MHPSRGLFQTLVGDGRPLLSLTALALLFAGCFALFLSMRGEFLPHDIDFLQQSAADLCRIADCRIVDFMFHDRVAFGGALISIGVMYLWLASFPLAQKMAWAWWTFLVSGGLGFLSFLGYLGYGYLDSWHGVGTVFLLPIFILGLVLSHRTLGTVGAFVPSTRRRSIARASARYRSGWVLMLMTAGGMVAAGAAILMVGITTVFVPQDLEFIGLERPALQAISSRLIPLIAHDRAGFGGGLFSTGIIVAASVYFGEPGRGLWQALLIAGLAGFGSAIGVHLAVGYTSLWHLAPAVAGCVMFGVAMYLMYDGMMSGEPIRAIGASAPGADAGAQHRA